MIIFFMFLFLILSIVCFAISDIIWSDNVFIMSFLFGIIFIIILVFGIFHGFIYYPPTEGTHHGIITAVDLEGIYFRRYEIYLKSGGFTQDSNGKMSNETKYLLYESEKDLADKLKSAIGKEVKINYGHDGGYISWKSCGTYHIKSFEIIDKE